MDCSALIKKIQSELEAYQSLKKTYLKMVKQRTLLESQLNENKCVLDELMILGPDNKVYKLYGPVLVKQDMEESRQNVGKRVEYISKELKSCTDTLDGMEKDLAKHREAVEKMQRQYKLLAAMM